MGLANSKQEAFWEACGFGHKDRVRRFIEEGIDVNWVSYTQDCCAIHAASQGKKEIVEMLIKANCDVNVLDLRGNLPLHHAAMKGHAEIMSILIEAGSEINTQEKNGWTPLINAAYWCQPEAVQMLIQHRCDVSLMNKDERHALHEACRSQSSDEEGLATIAYSLIAEGCDINSKSSDLGEADFTALMFASYHGHPLVAKALIEGQCDVNAQGSNFWSALHWAADRGHVEVVKVLLEGGVDPLLKGRRGELAKDRTEDNAIKELLESVTQPETGQRPLASSVTTKPISPPRRRSKNASEQDMNAIFNAVMDRYKTKKDDRVSASTESEQSSDKSPGVVKQSSQDSGNSSQAEARRSPVTTDESSTSGSSSSLSSPDTSPSDPGIKSTELYDTSVQDGDQSGTVQDGDQSDTVETLNNADSQINKADQDLVSDVNTSTSTDQDLSKQVDSSPSEPIPDKPSHEDQEQVKESDFVKEVDSENTQQTVDHAVDIASSQSGSLSSNTESIDVSGTSALNDETKTLPVETSALNEETKTSEVETSALNDETKTLPVETSALNEETKTLPVETSALNEETKTSEVDNEILNQCCSDDTEESSVSSQLVDVDGECQMDSVLQDTAELDSQETREELSLPGGTAPTAVAEDTDDYSCDIIDCNHDNIAADTVEDGVAEGSTEGVQTVDPRSCNSVHNNPTENTTEGISEADTNSSENTQPIREENINCT